MRVVVASDKFKGSLSAAQVAEAITTGLHAVDRSIVVDRVPVADGGDGTLAAALSAGFTRCPVTVSGPTLEPVDTAFGRKGTTAVVELADASGLARLPNGFAPLTATSIGTGQVISAAIDAGCTEIVLGIGGSSSTDGGAGLVCGLGARILDANRAAVAPGGAALADACTLDLGRLRSRVTGVHIVVASDVDSPLTGLDGAAMVYGPQKGASPADVLVLDSALGRWADLVAGTTGNDLRTSAGAGAAGGAGFAALALLGAELGPGIDTMLSLVGFDAVASGADVVVTGEGSLDEQSLRGKAPVGVVRAARRLGVPVVAVCGRTTLAPDALRSAGLLQTWSLSDLEPDPARSMADAAHLLEEVGATLARELPALLATSWSSRQEQTSTRPR
jgi:glycerate kinase